MKCPICNSKAELIKKNDKYDLYTCNECGLEFYWPLIADPDFYKQYNKNTSKFMNKVPFKHHELAIDYLAKLNSNKTYSLLDIGCANGVFLKALQARFKNFQVYGIDQDFDSVEFAKQYFGLQNVFNTSLDQFTSTMKFDVITIFDVLEHQTDPVGFLKNIDSLLTDDGIVIITVPNKNRIMNESEITQEDFPPHHYLLFDRISLYFALVQVFAESQIKITSFWREPLMVLSLYNTNGFRKKVLQKLDKFEKFIKKDRCSEVWFELLPYCKEFSFIEKRMLELNSFLKQFLVSPEIFLYAGDIDKKSALLAIVQKLA
jgi:SAM-dependent methyltransferase